MQQPARWRAYGTRFMFRWRWICNSRKKSTGIAEFWKLAYRPNQRCGQRGCVDADGRECSAGGRRELHEGRRGCTREDGAARGTEHGESAGDAGTAKEGCGYQSVARGQSRSIDLPHAGERKCRACREDRRSSLTAPCGPADRSLGPRTLVGCRPLRVVRPRRRPMAACHNRLLVHTSLQPPPSGAALPSPRACSMLFV